LLEHLELVEQEIERDMFAIAEPEHLHVGNLDRAAGRRYVAGRAVEDAAMRARECALLDRDITGDVKGVYFDVRVGKRAEPAAEKLDTCCFAHTTYPAGCTEDDVIRDDGRESVEVVGVEGLSSAFKGLAYGHCHAPSLTLAVVRPLEGGYPGFFCRQYRGEFTASIDTQLGVGPCQVALDSLERHV